MMKIGFLVTAAAFVLFAATACGARAVSPMAPGPGSAEPTAGSGHSMFIPAPPPSSVVASPPPSVPRPPTAMPGPLEPPTGDSVVPPRQIDASAMNQPPTAVRTTGGGRQVVFNVEQAGCQQITARVTGQNGTSVDILVVTSVSTRANQMCPMIVPLVDVTVQLAAPLGNRTIVFHAVTQRN